MTHEELLDKIQVFLVATELQSIDENFEGTKMLKALRAVVELHKPYFKIEEFSETKQGLEWGGKYKCVNCNEFYPCPTIQAIEKELK